MDGQSREQRLVLRVLAHWRSLCRDGALPRRSQIDPQLFGQDWASCLLIDVDPKLDHSRFAYVGENLRDPSWPTLDRQSLSECQEGTLLCAATSYVGRVLSKGMPISTGGVGIHQGEPIVYRSILLPLAESGERIDGMLGAANFREIPVTEEIHPRHEHRVDAPLASAAGGLRA
ncbi:MAG TPA: hypothetical protein VN668_16565 [Stellaceae bacterium]|nr:hypothetical protein [Stellaceae bacterium]